MRHEEDTKFPKNLRTSFFITCENNVPSLIYLTELQITSNIDAFDCTCNIEIESFLTEISHAFMCKFALSNLYIVYLNECLYFGTFFSDIM